MRRWRGGRGRRGRRFIGGGRGGLGWRSRPWPLGLMCLRRRIRGARCVILMRVLMCSLRRIGRCGRMCSPRCMRSVPVILSCGPGISRRSSNRLGVPSRLRLIVRPRGGICGLTLTARCFLTCSRHWSTIAPPWVTVTCKPPKPPRPSSFSFAVPPPTTPPSSPKPTPPTRTTPPKNPKMTDNPELTKNTSPAR